MEKEDFYKILCTFTPEELNKFISSKGKRKLINIVTPISPKEDKKQEEVSNGKRKTNN